VLDAGDGGVQAAQLLDVRGDHGGEGGGGQGQRGLGRGAQPFQEQSGFLAAAVGVAAQERRHPGFTEPGRRLWCGVGGQERQRDGRGQ